MGGVRHSTLPKAGNRHSKRGRPEDPAATRSFGQALCARIRWIGNAGCKVSKRFDTRTSSI